MASESNSELWQVEVDSSIYEAPLAELPEWIDEGSLQPGDKVRRGNLRWIEASKVPVLVPFFNAKARGAKIAVVEVCTDGPDSVATIGSFPSERAQSGIATQGTPVPATITGPATAPPTALDNSPIRPAGNRHCLRHPHSAAEFECADCGAELCRGCPRTYGGTVRVCSECGSMCRPVKLAVGGPSPAGVDRSEPFGIADLGRALGHPFKFRSSLFFGGLLFAAFTVGQSAGGWGGFVFLGASLFCMMLANMLAFGVLAHTVDNFVQGRLDSDFLPSFEDFSIWDDVVHPFFLSIGVYVTSFGPAALVAAVGFYLIAGAASDQMMKYNRELAQVPGTQYYSPDRTVEQSREVREVLEKVRQENERYIERQRQIADQFERMSRATESGEQPPVTPNSPVHDGNAGFEESAGRTNVTVPITAKDDTQSVVAGVLRLAAPLVVIGALAFLWGLIYFPAACAVAGYSRSFLATINPVVGLDTMRRLGLGYVKILLMGFLLLALSGVADVAVTMMFFPFSLAGIGNLPATAVGSFVTFYFSVVFSCLLGYALFKSADRLRLHR